MRPVRCVQKHGADVVKVPDSECPSDTSPNTVEKCNLQHCPARYSLHCIITEYERFPVPSCCLSLNTNNVRFYMKTHLSVFTDGECQSRGNVQRCAG